MPSFASPDYVHLRMAPNESQMQLINMDGSEPSPSLSSPCFDQSPYAPTTTECPPSGRSLAGVKYRSGKVTAGVAAWWRTRSFLEKFLLIIILILLCCGIVLIVLLAQFAADANASHGALAALSTTTPIPAADPTIDLTTAAAPAATTEPPTTTTTAKPEPKVCTTAGCVRAANYLMDAMNTTADPCDNFFEYACGQWNYAHPIPDDSAVYGTFSYVRDIVRQQLRVSLESDATHPSRSVRMAKTAYKICMNVTELEQSRSDPVLISLKSLGGWPLMMGDVWKAEAFDLTSVLGKARHDFANEVFFGTYVYADAKNTTRNIIQLDQGSLSLGRGSRDYYLNNTMFGAHMAAFEKFFYKTAMIIMGDAGVNATPSMNETIEKTLAFEKKMAEMLTPEDDRRNSTRQYNKMKIADLYSLLPQVDWVRYFKIIAPESVHDILSNDTEIIVTEVEYMKKLSTLLSTTDTRTIVDYLIWRVVHSMTKYLDDRYEAVRHELNRVMSGQQMQSPRWKECTQVPSTFFPLAAGALYVGEHFNKNDKLEAQAMIANIRKSFIEIVLTNDWMDQETKQIAIDKANAMVQLIGYPELITDPAKLDEKYQNIDISSGDTYFGMVKKVIVYTSDKEFNKLKLPFDKEEFSTSPAVVNAFYSTEQNSITFPAGILQPPFFSGSFPKAINYGAIGAVIGHEITHGFDDQGSQYDKTGNLVNWWNERSAKGFETRKQCIIDQYNGYTVPDTEMKVNGKLTLGENIADNGGVKEAYRAYRAHITESPTDEEPRLPGLQHLSNDQVFFLSYANFWCGHKTKAAAIQQVLQDEHSPEIFRVIGVLSNFPAFAKAFSCPLGSKLNPEKKCTVW
ncbi:hypothetical protein PFISCL1PPCAC_6784 [Pristionchus fissidentatus]|uniref:Uncharacterized protein n=1 Tax=Pristionchus fissidentatus TaxID=1538716 RepID=A0AAV5V781_9BILA|nr:hypothetical protein PFISCL1PPCAC_6784 [Pristionchus fissidentatus]